MAINPVHLAILESLTNIKWAQANGVDNQIASFTMTQAQANELKDKLDPSLGAFVQASTNEPGKFRVRLKYDSLAELINTNQPLLSTVDLITRTERAEKKHGTAPLYFEQHSWEQVNAEVDFAGKQSARVVSLGVSDGRERLFFNQNAPEIQALAERIAVLCKNKPVEEVLKIVNIEIDSITTNHPHVKGQTREQIEENLDQRLELYLEQRSKGLIPGKPKNLDVTMEELIKEGILVCSHQGLLAASMMGSLIDKGLLPFGSARQYRSEIQDKSGKTIGAHTWSVYRDATNGDLWVNDPRSALVKKVDANHPEAIGYGHPAMNKMVKRLALIDKPMMDAWKPKTAKHSIQEIISEIIMQDLKMAMGRGNNSKEWTARLVAQLNAIDHNSGFSSEYKNERMIKILSDTYLAAKQDEDGRTAAILIKNILKLLNAPTPKVGQNSSIDIDKIINKLNAMDLSMAVTDNKFQDVNELIDSIKKVNAQLQLSPEQKTKEVVHLLMNAYKAASTEKGNNRTAIITKTVLKELKVELPRATAVTFAHDSSVPSKIQQNENAQANRPEGKPEIPKKK